eukprot:GHVL01012552.1.p1 GENE.GHVL01012552.1~~GHVL01012552.1.p1  ORF type:complete len:123 (-),score=31.85 GHVL01012552.1:224-592(-)
MGSIASYIKGSKRKRENDVESENPKKQHVDDEDESDCSWNPISSRSSVETAEFYKRALEEFGGSEVDEEEDESSISTDSSYEEEVESNTKVIDINDEENLKNDKSFFTEVEMHDDESLHLIK